MVFDAGHLYGLILLLAAVLVGYLLYAGRFRKLKSGELDRITGSYYRGLHYLLQARTDKAIEALSEALENDSDNVEIHLALGHLFRQRGEVDRAIRLYQNLIARPTLSFQQRNGVLHELGVSYSQAGLFDRAEELFRQVSERSDAYGSALNSLLEICEQEQDWDKSIQVAQQLERQSGEPQGQKIAHYLCEKAAREQAAGNGAAQERLLKQALRANGDSPRANLMRAEQLLLAGQAKPARRSVEQLAERRPEMIPDLLDLLTRCYRQLDDGAGLIQALQVLFKRHPSPELLSRIVALLRESGDPLGAAEYLTAEANGVLSPLILNALVSTRQTELPDDIRARIDQLLLTLSNHLLQSGHAYQCLRCGFTGRQLHWCCPGCGRWETMVPAQASDCAHG
ncbi:MAG: tetratricopeptide repeat protein [Gammaproteobacteria bacterium]|nr:tetratricopeptide repeat protein [Gammaproteobacteria bacterium]